MDDASPVLFGGDCHLGEKPIKLDRRLRERIGEAEFLVVNQESPITGTTRPAAQKEIHLRSSIHAANWLQTLGVKVVSLANNHIADYGQESLEETTSRLRSAGIAPVGAGANLSEASNPAYVELPYGQTVAFLAFTSRQIGSKIADEHCYGCAELDPAAIEPAVRRARAKASHVVLLLHFGLTNFAYPTPRERGAVRSLVGCGVDLIIGHHPHVLQGHEILDGVPIFHSLGNLIFASYRKDGTIVPLSPENKRGALVAVSFGSEGIRIEDVIFTQMTETADHLFLGLPQSPVVASRSFEVRSRHLVSTSYEAFFRRYAIRRILRRLLLWTSPRRWRTFGGAQLSSLLLALSYAVGRKQ